MKKNIALLSLLFIGFLGSLLLYGLNFMSKPFATQKIAAWSYGGEFIDTSGVIIQTKNNNCGPTALKMIFDQYEIQVTLQEIEQRIELNEKGSSMLALKEMAELKGLKAEGWRLTLEDFLKKDFPLLLFVHNDHYIIVDSTNNGIVFMRDPALGRLKMEKNKLTNIWRGEALIFSKSNFLA